MIFAIHLSRNINPEASKVPTVPSLNLEVSSLELNASPSKLECIRQESECDPQMLILIETIIHFKHHVLFIMWLIRRDNKHICISKIKLSSDSR